MTHPTVANVPIPATPQKPPQAVNEAVRVEASTILPTKHGTFRCHAFQAHGDTVEHLALVLGNVAGRRRVPTRFHSECLTGDVFGSCKCDCGEQLEAALAYIQLKGCGILIYLRGHEGRGIGLVNKIKAYALQEQGRDTVQANVELGLPVDAREYGAAVALLRWLSVESISLLTNNPRKLAALSGQGVMVAERLPLCTPPRVENARYLATKRRKLGHLLPDLDTGARSPLASPASPFINCSFTASP
ncbi:GTP cyclohydrolase II [Cupriavidus sp. LEh25]|nr:MULTISPECIES: GTP cyclohydrolase II [unclassified Cupriavidus]MBP0625321.1 GTP cyclohydrolase II [Cupriavidus sp. LEh25]MDK2662057.1 GTP cyclohydrolase II [Cupriavidus sp. LEh21]